MGSLLAVFGKLPRQAQEEKLRLMAARSPYRGALRSIHFDRLSLAVQARDDESSLDDGDQFATICHGRLYGYQDATSTASNAAAHITAKWSRSGSACLQCLDGEFSLIVYDKRRGVAFACVSLSMTRFAYWAGNASELIIASEVRQAALGATLTLRLDQEQLVQSLCFGGPVLDTEQTEYVGIRRLVAPTLYQIIPGETTPTPIGSWWKPSSAQPLTSSERHRLPGKLLKILTDSIDTLPNHTAYSLSGGFDSGTLWAIANHLGSNRRSSHEFGGSPQGYSLTFPGLAGDESETIGALLKQTGTQVTLIDATRTKASEYIDDHVAHLDRIPGGATLYYLDLIGERMQSKGIQSHVTGIGAEAWLCMRAVYAADLLRHGHFITVLNDALRFHHYTAHEGNRLHRLLRFLTTAAFPPGSRLRQWRRRHTPSWLNARWHELFHTCHARLDGLSAQGGFTTGHRMKALRHYSVGSGIENVEQLCERYGTDLLCPYLTRSVTEFGFSTPGRAICAGRHPKYLLGACASLSLGGTPPWSKLKAVHDSVFDRDLDLWGGLGPTSAWALVQVNIVDQDAIDHLLELATEARQITAASVPFAYAERYARQFLT